MGDPKISPDGSRIAFVVTSMSEERDEYLSNIWVVDVAGGDAAVTAGEPRRFTHGPKRDTAPSWSPDGRRLAFLSEREGKKKPQLYVMPADGGEATRLTDVPHGVSNLAWSPDSTRLAFVARVGGWQEPESPDEKEKSKPPRVITSLKYKSNGEGFVYDRRPHIFVVAADGGAPVQITDGDFADSDPTWSADGQLVAFVSARHADRDYDDAADIWVVPAKGGEPRRLTGTEGSVALAALSPNGRVVAFAGRREINNSGGNYHVFTVPLEGGARTCLTSALDRSCPGPRLVWAPDGSAVLFAIEDQGRMPIVSAAANPSTRPPARIIDGDYITGFSISADGSRLAFTAVAADAPAELFVCDANGRGRRQLTDFNRAWRAEVAPATPESFTLERAGFQIQGWIMKPFGFEPGRKYPALLNVHGGPHAQYGHPFFDEFQAYAGAGYVVIYANPRGSQGYGEAFSRAVVGDWGGGDYADVMAALDEALRRFDFIDRDRLGVLGGSYGGFMTSWIVGHTTRFKAACSERAVNNQYTMVGTSDIGHWFQREESGGTPAWDDLQRYVDHSPLTYAKNITTPLLILHSEDDLRCPMEQAEQLFVALKAQKKDVLFVRFPDENHEMSRSGKPRHRLARFGFILDWFAKYLQPDRAASPAR